MTRKGIIELTHADLAAMLRLPARVQVGTIMLQTLASGDKVVRVLVRGDDPSLPLVEEGTFVPVIPLTQVGQP